MAVDEGPFVSFTDLFIGILFLFLILVVALMLTHQEAVEQEKAEAQRMAGLIQQAQARLDERARLDADHPPFRLAIVFNVYQAPTASKRHGRFRARFRFTGRPMAFV